jgi:PAS domain S-box-containing protein
MALQRRSELEDRGRGSATREPRGIFSRESIARRYFELTDEVLLALDADGAIRDINRRGAALLGLPKKQVLGRVWIETFLPEERRDAAWALHHDVLSGRREMPDRQEGVVLTAGGEQRTLIWRAMPLRDRKGRVIGALNSGKDITARLRAERALDETRENLRLAQHAGGVGLWWADADTGKLHNSPEALRLWGVPPGTDLTVERRLQLIHPDDRDRVLASYEAAFAGASSAYSAEYRVVRPDGAVVWLAARGEIVRDTAGAVTGMRGATFDITALKTAQLAAIESEARFARIADAAPMLVWKACPDKACDWVNSRWRELTGDAEGKALLEDRTLFVHPDDRTGLRDAYDGAFERRETYQFTYRLRRFDGAWRWIEEVGTPFFGPDGVFLGYIGAGADVTELKVAWEALHESEVRFRAFSESSRDVCCWMGDAREWHVMYANPAFETVFGWPLEALAQDPFVIWKHVHPEDVPGAQAAFDAVRRGETKQFEFRFKRANGEDCLLSDTCFPVFDDSGVLSWIGGLVRDVTQVRRAETALRRSEEKFRSFADNAEEIVWLIDACRRRLDYLNPAYERVTGERRARFQAHVGRWSRLVAPEDHVAVKRAVARALKGERLSIRFSIIRPDHVRRVLETAFFPLCSDKGEVRWIGGLSRDVTKSVHAQAELERMVAERTRELEASLEARHRAEVSLAQAQRLETVGRLTGGIAHDFNNLLTVVIGGLEMVLRRPDLPEQAQRLAEAALEAGRRGERISRQLLAFSRKQDLKLELVDLRRLLIGYEPLIRGAVSENIALSIEIEPDLGSAMVDPVQLEAALLNLVVNAGDAVRDSGRICVDARRVEVAPGELAGLPEGNYARLTVADTGVGMSPEVSARAFEPFFTTKEVGKGSGLGLAQVYGVAAKMAGTVTLESQPGEGTQVALYIPLQVDGPVSETPGGIAPEPLGCGCSVLLVEDDPGVLAVAENMLGELGCEVVTATDGASALQTLARTPSVAVLFTDVVMPGMSGPEVAEAALAARPDLKVILATGYASDRLDAIGDRWPILRKPYDAAELRNALRRALVRVA